VDSAISESDLASEKSARLALADCDQRLRQYRQVQGGDPATVAGWIAEVKAERLNAEATLAQLGPRRAVTDADMRLMIDEIEDQVRMLAEADPVAKKALYADLGIQLTYEPERNKVLVEAKPTAPWALEALRISAGSPSS
jgi:site-specific DNA recombinase